MSIRAACRVLAAAIATTAAVAGQPPPRDARLDSVAQVRDLSELAASTDHERELAGFFNRGFLPLRPGVTLARRTDETLLPQWLLVPMTAARRLALSACGADAVAIGRVTSLPKVIVNQRGTDLVTVYQVAVDRWVWPMSRRKDVVVGRPGGRVFVGGDEYFSAGPDLITRFPTVGQPTLFILGALGTGLTYTFQKNVHPIVDGNVADVVEPLEVVLDGMTKQNAVCSAMRP